MRISLVIARLWKFVPFLTPALSLLKILIYSFEGVFSSRSGTTGLHCDDGEFKNDFILLLPVYRTNAVRHDNRRDFKRLLFGSFDPNGIITMTVDDSRSGDVWRYEQRRETLDFHRSLL